jgi:hypothetical protein
LTRVELRVFGHAHVVWSVVVPIDLLVEGLGIERTGGARDTGDRQQSNKSGRDGLHGYLSYGLAQYPLQCGVRVCCSIVWVRPRLRREQIAPLRQSNPWAMSDIEL